LKIEYLWYAVFLIGFPVKINDYQSEE